MVKIVRVIQSSACGRLSARGDGGEVLSLDFAAGLVCLLMIMEMGWSWGLGE